MTPFAYLHKTAVWAALWLSVATCLALPAHAAEPVPAQSATIKPAPERKLRYTTYRKYELPPGVALVRDLYREYAWEAVLAPAHDQELSFIEQPRNALQRYLSPVLARRLDADRTCVRATGEICQINFAPLWYSQDPVAYDLRVQATDDPDLVRVQFNHPGSNAPIVLHFELVRTGLGLRIDDIRYPDGMTLRDILAP
jgi:hypothetical protein